jgi:hypothetical protein
MVVRTCKLTIQNSKISAAIDYNEWIAWRLQNHTKTSWNRAAGGGIWVTYRTVAGPHSRRGSAGPAASRRDLYCWNRRHGWHLSVSVAAGFVEQKQELNLNQRYSRSPLAWKGKDLGRNKNNLIGRLVKTLYWDRVHRGTISDFFTNLIPNYNFLYHVFPFYNLVY